MKKIHPKNVAKGGWKLHPNLPKYINSNNIKKKEKNINEVVATIKKDHKVEI